VRFLGPFHFTTCWVKCTCLRVSVPLVQKEMNSDISAKHRKPWKRVLYEKQNYRDNFVDPDKFLDQLNVEQPSKTHVSFASLFLSASVVAQQFTVVSSFITVYKYLLLDNSHLYKIAALDGGLLIVGYGVQFLLDDGQVDLKRSIHTTILLGIYMRVAAPVLRTLTSSFSGDTIHALALTFSTIHLTFHDYAYVNSETSSFSGTLSLNAAMFTAIILASRLNNIELVVALLFLAVICFSLFPSLARLVKKRSLNLHVLLTAIQWIAASVALFYLDTALFVAYESGIFIIWLLGPYVYFYMQVYKKSMRGPWDIAEVE